MSRHSLRSKQKPTVTPTLAIFRPLSSTRSSPPHVSDGPCCRRTCTTWGTSTPASPVSSSSRSSAGRSDPHRCGCRTPRACRARPPCRTPRRTARPRRGPCTRPHSRTRSPCPRRGEAPFTFIDFSGRRRLVGWIDWSDDDDNMSRLRKSTLKTYESVPRKNLLLPPVAASSSATRCVSLFNIGRQ